MKNLFEKYLSGNITAEEREQLLSVLHNDEKLGGWLRADIEFSEAKMPEPIRERILNNVYARANRSLISRRTWAVAAIMLILLVSGATGWLLYGFRDNQPVAMNQSPLTVATGLGEHSHVLLPDGTELTLNAQTSVQYNMQDGQRMATVNGEAYFVVARDEEHPFVVQAGEMQVTCLGTAFDVRNYVDEPHASVVLTNGKVRINANDADLTMEPGSRVVMSRSTMALSKQAVQASDYTAWLNGEIKYNNQTLEEIATELSRNYNINLVITSEELKHERFTGYLGRSSLRNILDVMCLAADMNYHIADDTTVYVYARKNN